MQVQQLQMSLHEIQKGDHKHFMLKEICEQVTGTAQFCAILRNSAQFCAIL